MVIALRFATLRRSVPRFSEASRTSWETVPCRPRSSSHLPGLDMINNPWSRDRRGAHSARHPQQVAPGQNAQMFIGHRSSSPVDRFLQNF